MNRALWVADSLILWLDGQAPGVNRPGIGLGTWAGLCTWHHSLWVTNAWILRLSVRATMVTWSWKGLGA